MQILLITNYLVNWKTTIAVVRLMQELKQHMVRAQPKTHPKYILKHQKVNPEHVENIK